MEMGGNLRHRFRSVVFVTILNSKERPACVIRLKKWKSAKVKTLHSSNSCRNGLFWKSDLTNNLPQGGATFKATQFGYMS